MARMEAAQALWNPSDAGRKWMDGYDFRQMEAQPAWFGSTGYSGFAGAGQAIPRIIMHELSHSMWGAFPVTERPDLTGQQLDDGTLKVVAAYREDLAEFLRQPPDRFEPLRDRFRNMPNLTKGSYSDLHHFGEADMISMTAGDLSLVPPILRKYLDSFYGDAGIGGHDFQDWDEALRWWIGLSEPDRQVAGEVFGLQHFPLDRYRSLRPPLEGTALPPGLADVLAGEDRQRLADFAEQLDQVKQLEGAAIDAAGVNRGFDFWRGYLIEIRGLHRKQPGVLKEHPLEEARQIGKAFDFYLEIESLGPPEQAARYRERQDQPYIADFPFLLKARAVVELFAGDGPVAETGEEVGGIVAGYAGVLAGYARVADEVIAASRRSPSEGGARLEQHLDSLSEDAIRTTLGTVLDLMREDDHPATAEAMRNLSVQAINRLLELRPEIVRNGDIPPSQLLAAVGVSVSSTPEELISGIARLVEHTSGNYAIDRPYDDAVYVLLDMIAPGDRKLVLDVFRESGLRLLPWIEKHPRMAAWVFRQDLAASAKLILDAADLRNPAPMLLHEVIFESPDIAAALLIQADALDAEIVARTFNQLIYDVYWSGRHAGPPADLSADAMLFVMLVETEGPVWTLSRITQGMSMYQSAIERGELDPDYVARHEDLLSHLLSLLPAQHPAAQMLWEVLNSLPGESA